MAEQVIDKSSIEKVVFDMDGTLYRKDIEYSHGAGTIQTAHDFFRFLAYDRMTKNKDLPEKILDELVQEYHTRTKNMTLQQAIDNVPDETKTSYLKLVEEYSSNGKVFAGEFGTSNTFLHQMIENIDYDSILVENPQLQQTMQHLKNQDYGLGILTTDTFGTLSKVMKVLGLNLEDFHMNTGDEYPVLCAENVPQKKPSPDGFNRIAEIYQDVDPSTILYIGDHFEKDIETSLRAGFQAIHVVPSGPKMELKTADIDGTQKEYIQVNDVSVVKDLL